MKKSTRADQPMSVLEALLHYSQGDSNQTIQLQALMACSGSQTQLLLFDCLHIATLLKCFS